MIHITTQIGSVNQSWYNSHLDLGAQRFFCPRLSLLPVIVFSFERLATSRFGDAQIGLIVARNSHRHDNFMHEPPPLIM